MVKLANKTYPKINKMNLDFYEISFPEIQFKYLLYHLL